MRSRLAIIFVSALLTACGGSEQTSNVNHAGHNINANAPTNMPTMDQNSMANANSPDHANMQSSPGASSAPYDLQFIDTMSVHHQGAVDMAMLVEKRAQHKELKELAASIIYDQEKEIGKMSEWRDKWFAERTKAVNMELAGMSHGVGRIDMKKLESLNGIEFDVEFVKQMIPHHEGAIVMAKDIQKQDSHAELKQLADDIIKAQEAEIKQMNEWLTEWEKAKR